MSQSMDEVLYDVVEMDEEIISSVPQKKLTQDQLLSEEINAIISTKPIWVIRHGTTIIGIILLGLLFFSWLIRYPDIVKAPLSIVAVNAPKKVIAKTEGKVASLFVRDGSVVEEKQVLAFLESTGDHNEVLDLRAWVTKTEQFLLHQQLDSLAIRKMPVKSSIGELQKAYYDFHSIYMKFAQTFAGGFYSQKRKVVTSDLNYIEKQLQVISNQQVLAQQDYELQKNDYQAKEHLANEKLIAPLELGQAKSKLIAKANALKNIESQMLNLELSRLNKQKDVIELQKEIDDYQQQFSSALYQFANEIDKWITKYIVIAPEQGQLQYITSLQKNQFVTEGQQLFFIAPTNTQFYGEIVASQAGFGKLKEKQEVIIEFESYPGSEYGYIHGNIEHISSFPVRDSSFVIQVSLPEGMKTNYGKILPFKNNLRAEARIITENKRLLTRYLNDLSEAFSR